MIGLGQYTWPDGIIIEKREYELDSYYEKKKGQWTYLINDQGKKGPITAEIINKNSDFNKTLINRGFGRFSKINETEIVGYFNTNLSSLVINNKCYCQSTCDCPETISEYQRWSGDFD